MPVGVGWAGFFSLDNSSGAPTDLTAYVTGVTSTADKQVFDVTVFGNNGSRAKTTGLKDFKMGVTFFNDPVLMLILVGLWNMTVGSTHSFVYGPHGNGSGKPRISGEVIMPTMPIAAVVDDVERIPAGFEGTGTITFDVFP
jgi:hypothetical protein